MSIWTRIIEGLGSVGGSMLEFLDALSRGGREPPDPEKSIAFTIGMIALGAKMAKADGVVTGPEVAAFKEVFHVPPEDLANVARVFNLAKQDVAGFDSYARRVGRLFARRPEVLEDVLDGLFHIAKADGRVHDGEMEYLKSVAQHFGFAERDFARVKARHVRPANDDPYIILGLTPGASDDQLKQRYRRLVRENHPDRHIAAGLPRELIALATEKLAVINNAYAQIARARGL